MKKILIIEDDTALRENTAELLELAGYTVFAAPNGSIGITVAKSELPDVIICDIMMPEIDGYGVLEAVLQESSTAQIPFIFLSAKTEHKEIRKGMDLGADDYLTKPFEEEELLSAIESRLAKACTLAKAMATDEKEKENDEDVRDLNALKNLFDDTGKLMMFNKGDVIYQRGAHANYVYLILKGVVKCSQTENHGKELITNLYQPDSFLGFTSFDYNTRYEETATAVDNVQVAMIAKSVLKEILTKNKNVSLELMNFLTDNLTEVKEQLLQMAYSSVRKKTAQTILHFARILNCNNTEEVIKISRSDLASSAGIATESLIRTLSVFKKKGWIETEGREIKIIDINALENVD